MAPLRFTAWIAVLLLVSWPAAAQDNPILQQMERLAAAYNAADAAALATVYTEDGVLLPPRAQPIQGREAIAAHYDVAFRAGASNLRFNILEIRQLGPAAAMEIGETLVDIGAQTINGRYMHVWVQVDGSWLLLRDMYHVIGAQ
ncbi:YybH family protein [Roseospira navarrensis]|uniref:SgcJ/EcaC family oxidoreductase n=1 Tax=Roseospira navarrensis TaxID=140058 RepID=A0A7X1ZDQ3_9PROT|nr:SgcJ/EcaC family oxidoreductase [Roseospira navarrensis]MQX35507.1 SgcJ/EcaC family oxidoreductase [Roseospira navarrensis]